MSNLRFLRSLFIAGVLGSFAVTWGFVKDQNGNRVVGIPAMPTISCTAGKPAPPPGYRNRSAGVTGPSQATGIQGSTVRDEETLSGQKSSGESEGLTR
jgi:hypothetical protein